MADRWSAAAALADRTRRGLYRYVRQQGRPVTREEAAAGTGTSRGLAAFHLDKLVAIGLLRARYQAPPHRPRGPGRSPKVYEPAYPELAITIPERRYELIAQVLADAVAGADGGSGAGDGAGGADRDPAGAARRHADRDPAGTARRHAYRYGQELGVQWRTTETAPGPAIAAVLDHLGFEPGAAEGGQLPGAAEGGRLLGAAEGGRLLLHNCPFHALADRHRELICGLNHAFLTGLVAGLGLGGIRADLVPRNGACCVTLTGAAVDA